ncbi:MAG: sel1 repeat family protein [Clostridia bacterium]|nr:sel1 repeat family protein [Clostridia bacterium]
MEPEMEAKLQAVIELCEEGDLEMCAFLGKEFYFGMNIPQDLDRALRYLTTAASAGDAMSQFLVGFMHWSGRGTQPDQDKALEWFLLASEQGIAEAMYNVAKILLIKNPKVNQEEALSWLERSSNAGYDAATDMLGDVREWIAEGANDEPPI